MHRAKAKSAPPRLKSKFVKNRTNAMKEIEAWVRKDNESYAVPEASRMSGQLSDNVTEERMLKAKLWELSKERYKFLSQNSYEKKVFQDRQQKKNGLRRVSSATATSDGRQRRSSRESLRCERRASLSDAVSRPRIRNARFAFLDRLDPTKNKKSALKKTTSTADASGDDAARPSTRKVLSRGNSSASVVNKIVESNPSIVVSTDGKRIATPGIEHAQRTSEKTFERPIQLRTTHVAPSFSKRPLFTEKNSSPDTTSGDTAPTAAPNTGGGPVSLSAAHSNSFFVSKPANVDALLDSTGQQTQTTVAVTWQSRNSEDNNKYGMKIESKTNDPRYSSLERKLCPLIRSKTTGDINTIVSEIESLHVRPRRRPADAPRSKIEVKACEFMKERGFVF